MLKRSSIYRALLSWQKYRIPGLPLKGGSISLKSFLLASQARIVHRSAGYKRGSRRQMADLANLKTEFRKEWTFGEFVNFAQILHTQIRGVSIYDFDWHKVYLEEPVPIRYWMESRRVVPSTRFQLKPENNREEGWDAVDPAAIPREEFVSAFTESLIDVFKKKAVPADSKQHLFDIYQPTRRIDA
jgi:hypothetical protein